MDLKTKIKNAIRRQGFTLEQVASQMKKPDGSIGLAQSALSQMLANGNPSFSKLEEIASIIGLSISELLQTEGERNRTEIECPYCHKLVTIQVSDPKIQSVIGEISDASMKRRKRIVENSPLNQEVFDDDDSPKLRD